LLLLSGAALIVIESLAGLALHWALLAGVVMLFALSKSIPMTIVLGMLFFLGGLLVMVFAGIDYPPALLVGVILLSAAFSFFFGSKIVLLRIAGIASVALGIFLGRNDITINLLELLDNELYLNHALVISGITWFVLSIAFNSGGKIIISRRPRRRVLVEYDE